MVVGKEHTERTGITFRKKQGQELCKSSAMALFYIYKERDYGQALTFSRNTNPLRDYQAG